MSNLTFKRATRQGVKPLIGLFGKSGGGKTFSALLLARGIVGSTGRIGLLDTENKRGSMFADLIPGGYETLDLDAPFSPDRYAEALDAAERDGIDCLVIDSMTHEWNGEGGYLDMKESALDRMAGDDWKKREKCAMAAAARCKPQHNKLVAKMLRTKMALILCFRAKEKVKMEKQGDRTSIMADNHASPIQDSGLIFEMLIAGEMMDVDGVGGYFRCTKHTHPDILKLIPREGEQLGVKHGEAIARWANNPGGAPVQKPVDPTAKLKLELWNETKSEHGGDKAAFETFLRASKLITDDEQPGTLTVERLNKILGFIRDRKAAQE